MGLIIALGLVIAFLIIGGFCVFFDQAILTRRGTIYRVKTNKKFMQGKKVVANVDCISGDRKIEGSHLLLAVGRQHNTNDLGLEKAGIVTNDRDYILVDDQLRTNVKFADNIN